MGMRRNPEVVAAISMEGRCILVLVCTSFVQCNERDCCKEGLRRCIIEEVTRGSLLCRSEAPVALRITNTSFAHCGTSTHMMGVGKGIGSSPEETLQFPRLHNCFFIYFFKGIPPFIAFFFPTYISATHSIFYLWSHTCTQREKGLICTTSALSAPSTSKLSMSE